MLIQHEHEVCLFYVFVFFFLKYRYKRVRGRQSLRQRHVHQRHRWLWVHVWWGIRARVDDDVWRYVQSSNDRPIYFPVFLHSCAAAMTCFFLVLAQTSTSAPRILCCVPSAVSTWWARTSVNAPQDTFCARTEGCVKVRRPDDSLIALKLSQSRSIYWEVSV